MISPHPRLSLSPSPLPLCHHPPLPPPYSSSPFLLSCPPPPLVSSTANFLIAPIYLASCIKQGMGLLEILLSKQPVQNNQVLLKGISANEVKSKRISVSVVSSILEVSPNDWDVCALDAMGPEKYNPFLTHGFLSSLEESNCVVKETGWMPRHMIVKDECENILGVVPLYLKSHSYGEFVFDHSWADAYYNFGARYYPKLQCCVPFTPVTGPRILIRNTSFKDQVFDIMVSALKELAAKALVFSLFWISIAEDAPTLVHVYII
nr:nuclear pore complex protein nup85 [Quercus suber]